MEKFTISIEIGEYKKINLKMEPSKDVMVIAKALSVQFHDCNVSVEMFARCRRRYLNGEITMTNPNLSKFYAEVNDEDKWSWSCFGGVTD